MPAILGQIKRFIDVILYIDMSYVPQSASVFQGNAGVQLLAFVCAIVASSVWLTVCTRLSWPVSTTYSIVSAVAGVGVAIGGGDAVNWGWNGGKGLATIFAGFVIAPSLAAGFAAVCYLLVKYGVLARRNPLPYAIASGPLVFFTVAAVCTMSIVFKGSPSLGLDEMAPAGLAAAIVGTGAVVALLSVVFWLPYVYSKSVRKDYTIRFYHFFLGPALWWRKAPEDAGLVGAPSFVPDYRVRQGDENQQKAPSSDDLESGHDDEIKEQPVLPTEQSRPSALSKDVEKIDEHPIEGAWAEPKNLYIILRYKSLPWIKKVLTHGTSIDIHAEQLGKEGSVEAKRMAALHAAANQ